MVLWYLSNTNVVKYYKTSGVILYNGWYIRNLCSLPFCLYKDNSANRVTLVSITRASLPNVMISKMLDKFENKSNPNLGDCDNNKTPKTWNT